MNICRGLFIRHRLIFAMLIAVQILKEEGTVTDLEWDLLVRGAPPGADYALHPENPRPNQYDHDKFPAKCVLQFKGQA